MSTPPHTAHRFTLFPITHELARPPCRSRQQFSSTSYPDTVADLAARNTLRDLILDTAPAADKEAQPSPEHGAQDQQPAGSVALRRLGLQQLTRTR
ncbi:MAG: hypothetical protein KGP12_08615 [Actinomycetales bacterium]|nr:hypothetical protein [Actinomycetales bacterium]